MAKHGPSCKGCGRVRCCTQLVEQFDRCLADTYSRAGRHLEELKLAASRATNEKMRLLQELGRIVLDPTITDAEVRALIYRHVSADELRAALEECDRLIRPADDNTCSTPSSTTKPSCRSLNTRPTRPATRTSCSRCSTCSACSLRHACATSPTRSPTASTSRSATRTSARWCAGPSTERILKHWDDLLRVAGSLKLG